MRARADVEVGLGIVMLAGVQTSGVSPSKPLDRIARRKKHGHLTFFWHLLTILRLKLNLFQQQSHVLNPCVHVKQGAPCKGVA